MNWRKEYKHIDQFEYVSSNQHGNRYKQIASKRVSVAKLSTKTNNAANMENLILLSNMLDVPVRYDFNEQAAFIKVVSLEGL